MLSNKGFSLFPPRYWRAAAASAHAGKSSPISGSGQAARPMV